MIKFHYHRSCRDVPRLGIERGDRLCHVYSDESREELLEWGRGNDLEAGWIDDRKELPHFDLHGERLQLCGPGVGREEFVEDLRAWRRRTEAAEGGDGDADGGRAPRDGGRASPDGGCGARGGGPGRP